MPASSMTKIEAAPIKGIEKVPEDIWPTFFKHLRLFIAFFRLISRHHAALQEVTLQTTGGSQPGWTQCRATFHTLQGDRRRTFDLSLGEWEDDSA